MCRYTCVTSYAYECVHGMNVHKLELGSGPVLVIVDVVLVVRFFPGETQTDDTRGSVTERKKSKSGSGPVLLAGVIGNRPCS